MRIERWQSSLAAMWVAQTMVMVAFSFFFPFIPLYVQTLGVRDVAAAAQWAGAITAASAFSMAIAQPIWGSLADRWGCKPMVIRSILGAGIIAVLMGAATTPEQLLVLRFIHGAVSGTTAPAAALVAGSVPKLRIGFALGLMQMSVFVGTSVGPLIGGLIAHTAGYRAAFYAAGVLMMAGAPIVAAFVREDFTPPLAAAASRRGMWAESTSLMAMALFPTLIGVVFLIQFGGVIVSPLLSLFVVDLIGGENAALAAGTIMALTGAASAVSALAVGRFGDRLGYSVILPICLLGAAASYFPQAMVEEVWQLLILRLLMGVFLGGLMPSANTLLVRIVPSERRGAAFGLASAAMSLANGIGPLSGAGIATQWGLRAVFLATGALYALASGLVSLSFRRHKSRGPRPDLGAS